MMAEQTIYQVNKLKTSERNKRQSVAKRVVKKESRVVGFKRGTKVKGCFKAPAVRYETLGYDVRGDKKWTDYKLFAYALRLAGRPKAGTMQRSRK